MRQHSRYCIVRLGGIYGTRSNTNTNAESKAPIKSKGQPGRSREEVVYIHTHAATNHVTYTIFFPLFPPSMLSHRRHSIPAIPPSTDPNLSQSHAPPLPPTIAAEPTQPTANQADTTPPCQIHARPPFTNRTLLTQLGLGPYSPAG